MPSVDAAMLRLRLVGTLAHEVPMALEQLLGRAGVLNSLVNSGDCTKFVPGGGQIAALLAHLLMLRTNGGLAEATALPDTFGTRDFVAAALAAKIPSAFWEDVAALHPEEWSGVPESLRGDGARVFDLFRVWRMDSGDYATMVRWMTRYLTHHVPFISGLFHVIFLSLLLFCRQGWWQMHGTSDGAVPSIPRGQSTLKGPSSCTVI